MKTAIIMSFYIYNHHNRLIHIEFNRVAPPKRGQAGARYTLSVYF